MLHELERNSKIIDEQAISKKKLFLLVGRVTMLSCEQH